MLFVSLCHSHAISILVRMDIFAPTVVGCVFFLILPQTICVRWYVLTSALYQVLLPVPTAPSTTLLVRVRCHFRFPSRACPEVSVGSASLCLFFAGNLCEDSLRFMFFYPILTPFPMHCFPCVAQYLTNCYIPYVPSDAVAVAPSTSPKGTSTAPARVGTRLFPFDDPLSSRTWPSAPLPLNGRGEANRPP